MKKLSYILLISLILPLWYCSDVKEWSDPTDDVPPGTVTNVNVTNINGGAIITYTLPDDNDLLGVKAKYSLGNKDILEVYSSAFKDTIVLDGYPDTNEYLVDLYTIDKSKNESAPVQVAIKPLTPPIELIRKSLKTDPTFGGVFATWENPLNKEMSISLYKKDETGDMVLFDTYYSNAKTGKITFRGLDSKPQDFKIELRDRWNNFATPLDTTLTPLFEIEILGSENFWQQWGFDDGTHLYRGDMHRLINNRFIDRAYDGILMSGGAYWHCSNNMLSDFVPGAPEANLFPYYFTIDMIKPAAYSRFRWWMRDRSPLYSAELPLDFEVWATNTPKPLDQIGDGSKEDNLKYWTEWTGVNGTDEWKNDWIKIADCYMALPSGATAPSELTAEDQEFVRAGIEHEIDTEHTSVAYRYLRFVVRSTNTGVPQFMISELKFWGAYPD